MAIRFSCKECGAALQVPDENAGKIAQCPTCQSRVTVPGTPLMPGAIVDSKPTGILGDASFEAAPEKNPFSAPIANPAIQRERYLQPHRGGLILGLGIASLLCNMMFVPGILAWTMGRSDLKRIRAGEMDPSGEGQTQAGMIMGIIMTCLALAGIAIYLAFIVVIIAIGVAGAAA